MGNALRFQRVFHVHVLRLAYILGIIVSVIVLLSVFVLPYLDYASILSPAYMRKASVGLGSGSVPNSSVSSQESAVHSMVYDSRNIDKREVEGRERNQESIPLEDEGGNGDSVDKQNERKLQNGFKLEKDLDADEKGKLMQFRSVGINSSQEKGVKFGVGAKDLIKELRNDSKRGIVVEANSNIGEGGVERPLQLRSTGSSTSQSEYVAANSGTPVELGAVNISFKHQDAKDGNYQLSQTGAGFRTNNSALKRRGKTISISQMNSLLQQNFAPLNLQRSRWSSLRDRELQKVRLEILNAPTVRNVPEIYSSVFRNYSMFQRSYQLMESLLKVYVYKEGEKPIFHQPHMRGIYASEGWFMKLIEAHKQFVVKDAKRAHLFYLPFSSRKLRSALNERNFTSHIDLANHLNNYVGLIAKKYRFWNRTKGADHFLVACHDWAPKFTRNRMGNCVRAICNTDIAKGFKIGKDVSLPVTYIRSAENPLKDVGGNPPSNRSILAFFAGGMHGYLRPILLQYWSNKERDMKILGPMPRDLEGKARYRAFMKGSRYCICARGYEVHTPRVVESIQFGCVPVIISDNYVPPLFETLDWEAFSVFVPEKDIPNLRSILLSIPEQKYIAMHQRVTAVQQHFLWHKKPLKYDIFHMILHSIWYNRVFQVHPG